MENLNSWRSFADALGYLNLPLTFFCRAELDSEPERVASVLEKLKEDCNNTENKDRKSFQKELMTVSPRVAKGVLILRGAVRVVRVSGSSGFLIQSVKNEVHFKGPPQAARRSQMGIQACGNVH